MGYAFADAYLREPEKFGSLFISLHVHDDNIPLPSDRPIIENSAQYGNLAQSGIAELTDQELAIIGYL